MARRPVEKRAARRQRGASEARTSRPLIWTDRAIADLEAIGDHIARDKPVAAQRWVMRLIAKAEGVVALPLVGRRVPELGRDDIREVFLRSYRIVYRFSEERIEILTVFEGHRLLPDDLDPR